MYRRDYTKLRRNEKCPCGSGLKYKKCCLKEMDDEYQHVLEDGYARERLVKEMNKIEELKKKCEEPSILLPGRDF